MGTCRCLLPCLFGLALAGCNDGGASGIAAIQSTCQFSDFAFDSDEGEVVVNSNGEPLRGGDPTLLYEDGIFKMWRTHWIPDASHPRGGRLGFAYATSNDGVVWTNQTDGAGHNVEHVLDPTLGAWDSYGVETPSVAKRGDTYYMLYQGYPGLDEDGNVLPVTTKGKRNHIGLATSTDGIKWVKHEANPVIRPTLNWEQPYLRETEENGGTTIFYRGGVLEASLLWQPSRSRFVAWYVGESEKEIVENGETVQIGWWNVGFATSRDGVVWQKEVAPVFAAMENTWEFAGRGAGHVNVLPDPEYGYHMFYAAGGSQFTIGHAFSEEAESGGDWERNPANPLMRVLSESDLLNGQPAAVYRPDEKTIYLYVKRATRGSGFSSGFTTYLYKIRCG